MEYLILFQRLNLGNGTSFSLSEIFQISPGSTGVSTPIEPEEILAVKGAGLDIEKLVLSSEY